MVNIIYTNIDQLDFTIDGDFIDGFINALEKSKQTAISCEQDKAIFVFNGFIGLVNDTGGKGGWQYILNTETETYTIRNKGDWRCRVSVRSMYLATYGYKQVLNKVLERIKQFMTIKDLRVGRIDIACDVQPEYWKLKPELFLKSGQLTQKDIYDISEKTIGVVFSKKDIETITIGKVNNLQYQVYNKTRQVNQMPKAEYWRTVWAKNPNYDLTRPVWRFEFRLGRDYFKRRRINDFADLDKKIKSIMEKVTKQVYMCKRMYKNISRDGEMCEVWRMVRLAVIKYAGDMKSEVYKMVDIRIQLQAVKKRREDHLQKSMIGFVSSIMALQGHDNIDMETLYVELVDQLDKISEDNKRMKRLQYEFNRKKQEFEYLEYGVVN